MDRRTFISGVIALAFSMMTSPAAWAEKRKKRAVIKRIEKTDEQWRKILTPEQYHILREEGTERAFSSPLDKEYREGVFNCAGCDLELFTSEMKFDSGTGWPSFYTAIEDHVGTKTDFKLLFPRREYHCVRCGGHQGHIFKDGPKPTGQRWCNNGLALKFVPKA